MKNVVTYSDAFGNIVKEAYTGALNELSGIVMQSDRALDTLSSAMSVNRALSTSYAGIRKRFGYFVESAFDSLSGLLSSEIFSQEFPDPVFSNRFQGLVGEVHSKLMGLLDYDFLSISGTYRLKSLYSDQQLIAPDFGTKTDAIGRRIKTANVVYFDARHSTYEFALRSALEKIVADGGKQVRVLSEKGSDNAFHDKTFSVYSHLPNNVHEIWSKAFHPNASTWLERAD